MTLKRHIKPVVKDGLPCLGGGGGGGGVGVSAGVGMMYGVVGMGFESVWVWRCGRGVCIATNLAEGHIHDFTPLEVALCV